MLDKEAFKRRMRDTDRTLKLQFGCLVIILLGVIAFWGGVIYVAWHFIAKYW